MANNEAEQKREKNIQNENRLRELNDLFKCSNIHIIGVPEEEEREKGAEKLFQKIIAEYFPNVGKETDIQIQEAQRTPIKINKSRPTPRHIAIKFAKSSAKKS